MAWAFNILVLHRFPKWRPCLNSGTKTPPIISHQGGCWVIKEPISTKPSKQQVCDPALATNLGETKKVCWQKSPSWQQWFSLVVKIVMRIQYVKSPCATRPVAANTADSLMSHGFFHILNPCWRFMLCPCPAVLLPVKLWPQTGCLHPWPTLDSSDRWLERVMCHTKRTPCERTNNVEMGQWLCVLEWRVVRIHCGVWLSHLSAGRGRWET